MKPVDVLCRPSPSPWDEIWLLAERIVALAAGCFAADALILQAYEGHERVLGVLVVSTASLLAIGELVIGADRRSRFRTAVLARECLRLLALGDDIDVRPARVAHLCDDVHRVALNAVVEWRLWIAAGVDEKLGPVVRVGSGSLPDL